MAEQNQTADIVRRGQGTETPSNNSYQVANLRSLGAIGKTTKSSKVVSFQQPSWESRLPFEGFKKPSVLTPPDVNFMMCADKFIGQGIADATPSTESKKETIGTENHRPNLLSFVPAFS